MRRAILCMSGNKNGKVMIQDAECASQYPVQDRADPFIRSSPSNLPDSIRIVICWLRLEVIGKANLISPGHRTAAVRTSSLCDP